MVRLSICPPGIMSKENARWSASLEGTAPPFIHTLLYLCDRPRTMTNFPSMTLTPGTRRTTSPALASCVRLISCADTALTTFALFLTSRRAALAVPLRLTAVTVISPSSWSLKPFTESFAVCACVVTQPASNTADTIVSLYPLINTSFSHCKVTISVLPNHYHDLTNGQQ